MNRRDGFLATHEGYFYLLDALPLWIGMSLYALFWPMRFLNHETRFELTSLDEQRRKRGPKRRKVNHACLYCRRSHSKHCAYTPCYSSHPAVTCDEGRPCQRW